MANYFVVNRPSNLIIGVVATQYTPPTDNKLKLFVLAPERALTYYYKELKRNPEVLMDIGELMAKSGFVYDEIVKGKSGDARPQKISYRAPQLPPPVEDRRAVIAGWITANPTKDAYELNDVFSCGMTAARAYIQEYRDND
ncbi:hypothetical protein FQZ97_536790 [compost metagenome]